MTLRMLSMPVWRCSRPAARKRREDLRHVLDAEPAQLDLLPRRDVHLLAPEFRVMWASTRIWSAVAMPFGMRTRSMK